MLSEEQAPGQELLWGGAGGAQTSPAWRWSLLGGCGGDSIRAGDWSHLRPWTLSARCAWPGTWLPGEPGMDGGDTGGELGWDVEAAEGAGQERQRTFLGWGSTSSLSRLYQRVIKRQSAGLRFGNRSIPAQKTTPAK